jgi:hypothetical protein
MCEPKKHCLNGKNNVLGNQSEFSDQAASRVGRPPVRGRWRRRGSSQRVSGLGFDGDEVTLFGARQEPVYQTFVGRWRNPNQAVLTTIQTLNLEFLTKPDVVLLANLCREYELTLRGYRGLHRRKIASYQLSVKYDAILASWRLLDVFSLGTFPARWERRSRLGSLRGTSRALGLRGSGRRRS